MNKEIITAVDRIRYYTFHWVQDSLSNNQVFEANGFDTPVKMNITVYIDKETV